jgi:hypothetical protein
MQLVCRSFFESLNSGKVDAFLQFRSTLFSLDYYTVHMTIYAEYSDRLYLFFKHLSESEVFELLPVISKHEEGADLNALLFMIVVETPSQLAYDILDSGFPLNFGLKLGRVPYFPNCPVCESVTWFKNILDWILSEVFDIDMLVYVLMDKRMDSGLMSDALVENIGKTGDDFIECLNSATGYVPGVIRRAVEEDCLSSLCLFLRSYHPQDGKDFKHDVEEALNCLNPEQFDLIREFRSHGIFPAIEELQWNGQGQSDRNEVLIGT